ncbi:MAG: hypothetical protein D6731_02665 [Planctomycetota bacterium]|nr:MAG: hypothetical protein D6731_02665 [Planctomycetota bacterium]
MNDGPTVATPSEDSVPLVDPAEALRARGKSPELAGLLAWLVPGVGHLYAGALVKGAGGVVLVLGLFLWGLYLSGGEAVWLDQERGHQYAFLAQIGAGAPALLGLAYSHEKLPGAEPVYVHLTEKERAAPPYAAGHPDRDAGLLFTMIAGLLNMLLVHDALSGVPGAYARRLEERRRRERLDALRTQLEAERAASSEAGATGEGEAS